MNVTYTLQSQAARDQYRKLDVYPKETRKMQGNTTAFNLGEAQKRHIVVGCGLHRIVTPSLRQFVEPTMQKAYDTLKSKNHVHTQTFQNHIKEYNGFKLNYRSINNNNSHKGKAAEKKYDYKVSNPVDFAKLFLQPFMAHMTGFDDSCDMSALLGLFCNMGDFSQDIRDAASQVRSEVRNKWAHCDFNDWTQVHFSECFQLMEELVTSLKLSSSAEQKCVQELRDWEERGVQLILGQAIDKDLLRVVQQDVAEMQSNLVKYKESSDSEVKKLVEQLKSMKEVLAQTEEKFEQGQATLRRDVDTIGETVTEIEGRVTTLEDGQGQLPEQVRSLEDREANVEKEVGAVAEKVENMDRSLTDFQQRQADVNTTVAKEQEVQDERLQTLEKGQVKLEQRVDSMESQQKEVYHSGGSDDQTSAFTSALTINYNNTLKTLKPLPWDDRFCLDLDKIFTRLVLVGHNGHEDRGITFESLDKVFDYLPISNDEESRRFNVLVVGDAGSGKSTLFSKTALDWSRKKGRLADMNKIVLLIRLREVEPGESIAEIVWDQCVTKSAKGISISSIEACLQDNESDVVFLLDGYDELVPDATEWKQAIPELLEKKWYPDCTVIVTARPTSGIERYMAVDCKVNVMGFSSALVDKYVPLYFKSVRKPDLADSLVKALDSEANIVARGLIQTPMFLMLICVLWEENPTIVRFQVTMSGLYQELLTCVIRKHCVREGLPVPNDENEIPSVVSTALCYLGKLALESLLRGESLVDLGKNTANQNTDVMVNLGIVSKEVSASRLHPREQLNFPHKSMQEFLAGRYVANRVNTFSDDLHSLVPLDTVSTVVKQENLMQFICGHGGKVTGELLANLNTMYVAEEDYDDLKDLKRHLCMMCLYEGNDSQHLTMLGTVLSSIYLDINIPCREAAALKYYLDNAVAVPEGRSLTLIVRDDGNGDAVEYLSNLVEKPTPDLWLYLTVVRNYSVKRGSNLCPTVDMLGKLIPFLVNVPNMHLLKLEGTSFTPESLKALTQILPKLEKLVLSYNEIGNKEKKPFAAIQQSVASLKELDLSNNKIGDVCLGSLAAVLHHLSCLEDLNLSYNQIGNEGKEPFAVIQQSVASLKVLNLSNNQIGDVCLGSLAAVLHHLSCLENLNLSENQAGNKGAEPFADIQQPVASLKVLDLSHNKIGDVCLGSLGVVLHYLSCLENLDLSFNDIGREKKKPFAAIQQPVASLKVLNLFCNKIQNVCLGSLVGVLHYLSCLEKLDLRGNFVWDDGLEPFAIAIQQPVASLKDLNLSRNQIGNVCLGSLASVLHHLFCLEILDLSENRIGDENMFCYQCCLAELGLPYDSIGNEVNVPFAAIQQPVVSLKVLRLSKNKIGDVCLGSLLAVLHHLSCLEYLDLSHNNIGDTGKEPFSDIQQPVGSLKWLNLSHNKIGDVCLGSLAAVLHHLSCLENLYLSHNNIGDEEKEPFAAIQQPFASLKWLDLSHNKIGDVCLGSLVAVLHHLSYLMRLYLSHNNIGDAGVESLAATLHHAPTLEYVYLNDNPVTAVGLQRFAQTIQRMPTLKGLYLDPQQTAHLDDFAAMSICTMLTQLPVLEWLSLLNISMPTPGLQAVAKAAEEHPTLQALDIPKDLFEEASGS